MLVSLILICVALLRCSLFKSLQVLNLQKDLAGDLTPCTNQMALQALLFLHENSVRSAHRWWGDFAKLLEAGLLYRIPNFGMPEFVAVLKL